MKSMSASGSPPRLWGKPLDRDLNAAINRFTPTPVGKTSRGARSRGRFEVHPHACGENTSGLTVIAAARGSPPRLWGKLLAGGRWGTPGRFTPTPVGKTGSPFGMAASEAVHPHACGENDSARCDSFVERGSPPRLWGKQNGRIRALQARRFTPTPVGKTFSNRLPCDLSAVHPHACGENRPHRPTTARSRGSPPRLWGKRSGRSSSGSSRRFTPTPVGKTYQAHLKHLPIQVHPHACGENMFHLSFRYSARGSPPRLWGKRHLTKSDLRGIRFTPTPVGKTWDVGG